MAKTRPLKILMTADPIGGVWTYVLELIKAMVPNQVEVALATMGAPLKDFQREQLEAMPQVKLYESIFKLEWMENPWDDVEAAGRWLMGIKKEFKPDIIHLNNFAHGNLKWEKPVVMVVHSCVQTWWHAVKKEPVPASWGIYCQKVKKGLQAADVVVAPSQAMLEDANTLYGPFRDQKVIYNGRKTDDFHFGQKEPFIFSMGRLWDEAKNIQLLTQVATELDWPVYVAGDAAHPGTCQVQDLPNIYFLGQLAPEEVMDYISRASIFALPALYEPFGLSALEAGLSGCALVLSAIPSQIEIWEQAATYVNPNDAAELKEALAKLIRDEAGRTNMGYRALQQGQRYSDKTMAFEYGLIYKELIYQQKKISAKEEVFI